MFLHNFFIENACVDFQKWFFLGWSLIKNIYYWFDEEKRYWMQKVDYGAMITIFKFVVLFFWEKNVCVLLKIFAMAKPIGF